jgi:aryl-alcohol dehydrogenase-like predicted oxidoreductase
MADFNDRVTLAGNLQTARMGIGSDAGIGARALEWAFERGLNYFYWGTQRTAGMKEAIRTLAPTNREKMVVALQTYDTTGLASGSTFRRGLRQLGLDYADVLILGKRDAPVSRRARDSALALKDAGLVKHLCISAHDRSNYRAHLAAGLYDIIMVRYNCAHPGAEGDIFPLLAGATPKPSVIVYNSTRWGHLFDPKWMPDGERTPEPTHLYRHALTHSDVDMVLTAPSTEDQLIGNVKALDHGPLDPDELEWLSRIGKHVHALNPNTNWDFLFSKRGPGA